MRRNEVHLQTIRRSIHEFTERYQRGQPTLILFPGGLASKLIRTPQPRIGAVEPWRQPHTIVWLNWKAFVHTALALRMQEDDDVEDAVIVADGPVAFLNKTPYDRFIRWCALPRNNFNWFIFGWDWRRRLEYTVDFFLQDFLPALQKHVIELRRDDPLDNVTLIGHSSGGLIVKLILHRERAFVDRLSRAVTVATPFYGYGGQIHRYFEGEPLFNWRYGRSRMAQLIGSMPGCYPLLFLDERTYARDAAELANDTEFPLRHYPSRDASTGSPADPYNPAQKGSLSRYPTAPWFNRRELQHAGEIYRQLAAPLDDAANQKFYNFRGVRTRRNVIACDTVSGLTWDWVRPDFDPDKHPSPIRDDMELVPGDDTQPAWSTRLVSTPPGNVRTLKGNINHAFIMGHSKTLIELGGLLSSPYTTEKELDDALGSRRSWSAAVRSYCSSSSFEPLIGRRA